MSSGSLSAMQIIRFVNEHRVLRFAIAGGLSTATYLVLMFALPSLLTLPALYINVLAVFGSSIVSYVGQKYFTFRLPGQHVQSISKFIAQTVSALVVSSLLVSLFAAISDARIGAVLAAVSIPLFNYYMFKYWTFAHRSTYHKGTVE
ncbi:MAG: GtrA-like protein [Xanthobacteraceae bacterium]|jgi:putative flippase GtrA|nr:GtrA-like protein [Xanthobacteraceae bacterium]